MGCGDHVVWRQGDIGDMIVKYDGDDRYEPFKFSRPQDASGGAAEDEDEDGEVTERVGEVRTIIAEGLTPSMSYEVVRPFTTSGKHSTTLSQGQVGIVLELLPDGSGIFNFGDEKKPVTILKEEIHNLTEKKVEEEEQFRGQSVKITFLALDAQTGKIEVNKVFTHKPLDMEYSKNKQPLTVKRLTKGGYAEEHGVEIGWTIAKVDDEDIRKLGHKEADKFLRDAIGALPGLGENVMTPSGAVMLLKGPHRTTSFGRSQFAAFKQRLNYNTTI